MPRPAPGSGASVLLAAALLWLPGAAAAQDGPAGSNEAGRSVLDGVYTEEQADRGRQVYERSCSLCHGPLDFSGDMFRMTWAGRPLGALFTHIRTQMPLENPGSLTARQYADVVAYILKLNAYPAGENALAPDPEAMDRILVPRTPDPR